MNTEISDTNRAEEVCGKVNPKFRIFKILLFTLLLLGPLAYIVFVAIILFIKAQ